jgi:hypothetical protein
MQWSAAQVVFFFVWTLPLHVRPRRAQVSAQLGELIEAMENGLMHDAFATRHIPIDGYIYGYTFLSIHRPSGHCELRR